MTRSVIRCLLGFLVLPLLNTVKAQAQATQNYGFNDHEILLRNVTDTNHGLGWYGAANSTKNWLGQNVDGPVLYGYTGGVLGINRGGSRQTVLTWNYNGNVGIGLSDAQYPLHVVGAGYFAGPLTTTGLLTVGGNSTFGGTNTFNGAAVFNGGLSTTGALGIGTNTPAAGMLLHLRNSDTPALRLEQTNAGGFTAQTWDIGANEANFFVRDLTGGSRLPFRIRPGAPTSSLDISASGNVGLGLASPQARLHVAGSVKIDSARTLEFGARILNKDPLSGTIGYGNLTTDALNIVGAGTGTGNQKIELHAAGGTTVQGGAQGSGTTLRVVNGNTPGLRLDQLAAGGWGTQVWEVAGNEANFFVRDLTNGNLLPLRIRPGAPTSSIDISASGNVGLGLASPQARLHVAGSVKINGASTLEFGADVSGKQALAGTIGYGNLATDALNIVGAGTTATNRKVAVYAEGGITITGNLTLQGVVSSSSDARLKTDVRPIRNALAGVQALQGRRYRFRAGQGPQGEQVGFIAQELEQVYPELVSTDKDGLKAVNYAQLTPILVEALKEQQRQLEQLRTELSAAQAQLRKQQAQTASTASLETRLKNLETLLGARAAE
ncbi:tail fiber domain-containing protein [Hymenobacter guriensis]|uniref:Tail fiber domain-containing protein n=1 Tax=Hymenobacter guriensis TaxID=2793065 RepID=A0ABS0L893_9BACT|nr:tail fiber domain-containing protein [Hymenobacter guriensis]MBG8556332.1 tail fiber domain-containing protein [Hymenobacter guriensis]